MGSVRFLIATLLKQIPFLATVQGRYVPLELHSPPSSNPQVRSLSCSALTFVLDSDSFQHGHKQTECSSSGLCDRSRGVCTCFPGFSGAACQRKSCLGSPMCSGRGRCYDMSMLSSIYEAFPLRATASNERYFYEAAVDSSTWDGDLSMGCVCDSGWRVGLGNGETQLAEFFGPACEFRRCPSGDDPTTPSVNETDCSGKSQVTGILSGVGEDGNLCHYECSGRGKCDYQTGVCKCYPGVEGPNCGRLVNPARYNKNS
jgi:hypothetical protein